MSQLLLAIDQGTTGTKVLLMDEGLKIISDYSEEFEQYYPKPGWVEHQPKQIWETVLSGIQKVTTGIDTKKIAGIGITNQRETVCFWNKKTGNVLSNAIVWQDRRTADICEKLKSRGLEKKIQSNTGLLLDPYFSGTKISWALENWGDVKTASDSNNLAVGTIDSFLIHQLTGGLQHVTEPSNASRTLCYHLTKHCWDEEICRELQVPIACLPKIQPSTSIFGKTKGVPGLQDGIPISGCLGDQQAALLGQTCIEEGSAKCTFGTGAFLLLNTGKKAYPSKHRLLTTIAWSLKNNEVTYALEGSVFIAGAAVQWLRDGIEIISTAPDIEKLASSVESSDGVIVVPSFTGLGAPYWDPSATGMITGITRGTTRAHIARATLEGIAFQNVDILNAMENDLGKPIKSLNVDGGASANNQLMQFQSDILGIELKRPKYIGSTSLGAIFAAGLGSGIWSKLDDIKASWQEDRTFKPKLSKDLREKKLDCWHHAVRRVQLS